jgi:hypothetical protein
MILVPLSGIKNVEHALYAVSVMLPQAKYLQQAYCWEEERNLHSKEKTYLLRDSK